MIQKYIMVTVESRTASDAFAPRQPRIPRPLCGMRG
jgi:hypothetical protein